MDLMCLKVEVGDPTNPDVTETIEFLIDSDAIYSVVPTPMLERLGIKPIVEQEFQLPDGSRAIRQKGAAIFKLGERSDEAD